MSRSSDMTRAVRIATGDATAASTAALSSSSAPVGPPAEQEEEEEIRDRSARRRSKRERRQELAEGGGDEEDGGSEDSSSRRQREKEERRKRRKKKKKNKGGSEVTLAGLPDVLLHDIFRRVMLEGLEHAVRLIATSRALMSAFGGMPALELWAAACQRPGEHLEDAVGALLTRTSALQTLRLSLDRYDPGVLWFWLRHVRSSLRELEICLGDRSGDSHTYDGYSESSSESNSDSESDYSDDGLGHAIGARVGAGSAERSRRAIAHVLARTSLPEVTSLALRNVRLEVRFALPKLTSLTLSRYRFEGAEFGRMLEGLPLLKSLTLCESRKSVVCSQQIAIRHSLLEVIRIPYLLPGRRVQIQAPSLQHLCLTVRGDVSFALTESLQSVHIDGATDLTITKGGEGEDLKGKAPSKSTGSGEETAACGSGMAARTNPPLKWISVLPSPKRKFGNMAVLFGETSHLELLQLETWQPGPSDTRLGPFPKLKWLYLALDEHVLDAFALDDNFPNMATLMLSLDEVPLKPSKLRALDTLLAAPRLRSVLFINDTGLSWPPWIMQWFTSLQARYPLVHVTFGTIELSPCTVCHSDELA